MHSSKILFAGRIEKNCFLKPRLSSKSFEIIIKSLYSQKFIAHTSLIYKNEVRASISFLYASLSWIQVSHSWKKDLCEVPET